MTRRVAHLFVLVLLGDCVDARDEPLRGGRDLGELREAVHLGLLMGREGEGRAVSALGTRNIQQLIKMAAGLVENQMEMRGRTWRRRS